jgi:hypothetical protein
MAHRLRNVRYSTKDLLLIVTLAAVALAGLPWSATASRYEWSDWVLGPVFVGCTACAFGAAGALFQRALLAAKIGATLSLGLYVWFAWEMRIWELDDRDLVRYWPESAFWRYIYISGRAAIAFAFAAGVCLLANQILHFLVAHVARRIK